jgi:hypothetical protein
MLWAVARAVPQQPSRGIRGTSDFFTAALAGKTCRGLTEPGAADSFSPEILRPLGIDISTDYLDVGSISSTRSLAPQKFEHRLLKPLRKPDMARLACEHAKRLRTKSPK